MVNLQSNDPVAMAAVSAIKSGGLDELQRLFKQEPDLAKARILEESGVARSLLHVAADWPGRFPNGARTVATLIAAGADVNAALVSSRPKHAETPLRVIAVAKRPSQAS